MSAVEIKTPYFSTWLDNSKAKFLLGWRPRYDLKRLIDESWTYDRPATDPAQSGNIPAEPPLDCGAFSAAFAVDTLLPTRSIAQLLQLRPARCACFHLNHRSFRPKRADAPSRSVPLNASARVVEEPLFDQSDVLSILLRPSVASSFLSPPDPPPGTASHRLILQSDVPALRRSHRSQTYAARPPLRTDRRTLPATLRMRSAVNRAAPLQHALLNLRAACRPSPPLTTQLPDASLGIPPVPFNS